MTRAVDMQRELHRPVSVDRIGEAGFEQRVEANAVEMAALARRLGIPALASLSCRFHLARAPGGARGIVAARGELEARLTRVCVVSLDEFETVVREEFRVSFVPAGQESDGFDPDADDEIPYHGGEIDLGEAAVEQLALALEPYPRKPGADPPGAASEAAPSPFAALQTRRWKN